MTDPQGATDKATNTVGNFNTHLLVIDRHRDPHQLGNNKLDWINIPGIWHPATGTSLSVK